jgi:hypothetical protein
MVEMAMKSWKLASAATSQNADGAIAPIWLSVDALVDLARDLPRIVEHGIPGQLVKAGASSRRYVLPNAARTSADSIIPCDRRSRHLNRRLSRPDLTACRIQQSTGEILKFEANLAKMLLGFVILEGSDDFLQQKTAVDNRLQTIGRYRPNHVLLICSAANGDPADTNLIRKQCRDRHFSRKTSQDAD